MIEVIIPLAITLIISTGVAFGLHNVFGFWETFTLTTIFQYVVAYIWKGRSINLAEDAINEMAGDLEEVLGKSVIEIKCPCSKYSVMHPVFVTEDITIECPECGNTFGVSAPINTFLITDPLSVDEMYKTLEDTAANKIFKQIKENPAPVPEPELK